MNTLQSKSPGNRWERAARWFLIIAYGVGSPAFAIAEAVSGIFSARFGYPPEFLYLVSVLQFASAALLLFRRFELVSLALLTIMSLGAIYSHFRIDSPLTALPSLAFTIIQMMYARHLYLHNR